MVDWLDAVPPESLRELPEPSYMISWNGISLVCRDEDNFIYKRSIPFLIENEQAFLLALADTNFVPACSRYDKYTLRIENLWGSMPITDPFVFVQDCKDFLATLTSRKIRHGDLTKPHVLVRNNRIKVIDWAEARWEDDPAPDKRVEGDEYWLDKTMKELLK